MVTLQLHRPHWIKDDGDDPMDQCAHGFIELAVNSVEFSSATDGNWTVSAAALFLLRTVSSDHSSEDSVAEGNLLLPCCGFNIWPMEGMKLKYSILGCTKGIDPKIKHRMGMVNVSLGDKSATAPLQEWAEAVLSFSDQVQHFYDSSTPKAELDDDLDRAGWDSFWKDWRSQSDVAKRIAAQ